MQKKLLTFFFKNLKSIGLLFLIILTIIIAAYSNQKENLSKNQNNDFINNIYFKKTLNEIVNNLEPRYKKYNHKIKSGETFDKILSEYSIEKEEIIAIKESLSKKFNINKLNTNQKIEIILEETSTNVLMTIKDEGPGFSETSTQKIFKRFYSNRPASFGKHSGLGLNIVKNIVELHKGTIAASNRIDTKGALVEVLLPKYS